MHFACWSGNVALLQYLLEDLGLRKEAAQVDSMRQTALHYAVLSRRVDTLQCLLELDNPIPELSPHALDESNHTPLHVACKEGNYDAVVYLLENTDSSPVMQCNIGATCLIEAAMEQFYMDIVEYIGRRHSQTLLIRNFNGDTILHFAAKGCFNELFLRYLVSHLQELSLVDSVNQEGWSPLHYAARHGNTVAFKTLFRAGADVSKLTKCGHSMLHLAAQGPCPDTCSILVYDAGISPDVVNSLTDKSRPLHLAAATLNFDNVKFLVENGASVTATDIYSSSALHYACCNFIAGKEAVQVWCLHNALEFRL